MMQSLDRSQEYCTLVASIIFFHFNLTLDILTMN